MAFSTISGTAVFTNIFLFKGLNIGVNIVSTDCATHVFFLTRTDKKNKAIHHSVVALSISPSDMLSPRKRSQSEFVVRH